ncbi:MAG: glycosyltransferase family 87 protein, partial [Bacteroidota bacterium]
MLAIIYCSIEAEGNGDFYIFMWAAGELGKGLNIYDHKYNDDYSYYYSVLFAMLLKPFYTLSFFWVKFCWLIFNLMLFVHLVILLIKSKFFLELNSKQKTWFLAGVLIFSFRFLHENIHYAQITILMLWTCIYGLYSIYQGQSIKGSIILAIGINIKLFPLVFIPYLIYRGFFKEVFYVCIFYLGFMFLPSIFIGHAYNISMLKSWWLLINPGNTNHILDVDERSFHGMSTL